MLEESWGMAQDRLGEYKVKIKGINSHVMINLYGLNHLSAETKAAKVKELLLHDCFVCKGKCCMGMENRFIAEEIVELIWNKYFMGIKIINKQFICLVASVIWHCLKSWSLGTFNQNSIEFKYETAFSIYDCLIKAWEDHSDQVQDLIVANVKAEEMVVHSVVGDMDQYEMELREWLFNHRLPQSDTSTEQDTQRQD
ncbi:hypothetical protein BDZ91DRAFT_757130 [Kalaharituber pfeilii]|nr:hypothetical protein BDZ91DRAFT_757130 [Kalaharituber pfeilii]